MVNKSMGWASQRQKLVSQNLANINTPHYKPVELMPLSFAKELNSKKTQMKVTNAMHRYENSINVSMDTRNSGHIGAKYAPQMFKSFQNNKSYETSLDGNGVVLEEESLKLSENRTMYDRAATIYQKYNTMLQTAIGND